jgi:prevent-host-death family protein
MASAARIKPISYFKANAAEILQELNEVGEPMIITQNGEARAVVQDIVSYEKTQETLALLKILALGEQQVREGKTIPASKAMQRFRTQAKPVRPGK